LVFARLLTSNEVLSIMLGKLLLCSTAFALTLSVAAADPVDNINAHKHPNLASAQRLVTQAYENISAAQVANEWDLGGHAQKAKELLDQANRELKAAAVTANEEHHH
jgi:hypothetical protein